MTTSHSAGGIDEHHQVRPERPGRVAIKLYLRPAEDHDLQAALAGVPARARAAAIRQALRDARPLLATLASSPPQERAIEVTVREDEDQEIYRLLADLPYGSQSGVLRAAIRHALAAGTFDPGARPSAPGRPRASDPAVDPMLQMLHAFD